MDLLESQPGVGLIRCKEFAKMGFEAGLWFGSLGPEGSEKRD